MLMFTGMSKALLTLQIFLFFIEMQQLLSGICTENRNSISCRQISRRRRGPVSVPAVEQASTLVGLLLLLWLQTSDSDSLLFVFSMAECDWMLGGGVVSVIFFSVCGGGSVNTQLYWSVFTFCLNKQKQILQAGCFLSTSDYYLMLS